MLAINIDIDSEICENESVEYTKLVTGLLYV